MPQPLIELGGDTDAPVMHIGIANGFVPQTYIPLLRHFTDTYRPVALVPRALWGDGSPPPADEGRGWLVYAHDILAGMQTFQLNGGMIAIGHSFGGVASLLAALQKPEAFRALILLDPTILPQPICETMRKTRDKGEVAVHPLAKKAKRRRRTFDSIDAAFERFRDKSVFSQWSDETLRLYVEYGTVAQKDGTRVLTWSPEWEAFYYSTPYIDIWERLPELNALDIPKLIITGEHSDIYTPQSREQLHDLLPAATHHMIDGHGHLFPQSAPDTTARLIQTWLKNT